MSYNYSFTAPTATSMLRLGSKVAKSSPKGSVIALTGPLGSGKSVFARGFIRHFGIQDHIISPTFTLLQSYTSPSCTLNHFDLYRLSSLEEFELIGGRETVEDEHSISLIEWPEIIQGALSSLMLCCVNISLEQEGSRAVSVVSQFEIK